MTVFIPLLKCRLLVLSTGIIHGLLPPILVYYHSPYTAEFYTCTRRWRFVTFCYCIFQLLELSELKVWSAQVVLGAMALVTIFNLFEFALPEVRLVHSIGVGLTCVYLLYKSVHFFRMCWKSNDFSFWNLNRDTIKDATALYANILLVAGKILILCNS